MVYKNQSKSLYDIIRLIMKKILILLLLLTSCATKHHVITEDGVNWYTTEEQE